MRKPMLPTISLALSSTALGLAIFNGAVLSARVQQLTQERDIYASRFQNWSDRALRDEETIPPYRIGLIHWRTARFIWKKRDVYVYGVLHGAVSTHLRGGSRNHCQRPADPGGRDGGGRPNASPYGTVLYIEGVGIRIVQDKGAGVQGYHLDVAVDTHENALAWSGYGEHRVWDHPGSGMKGATCRK